MNRVVITGIGCCTSLGWEQGGIARAFAGGCPAFAPSEALPGYSACPVSDLGDDAAYSRFSTWRHRRYLNRGAAFAVLSGLRAAASAGFDPHMPPQTCLIGASGPMLDFDRENGLSPADSEALDALWLLRWLPNTGNTALARFLDIHGEGLVLGTACASALQAIGEGFRRVRYGLSETVLCSGGDSRLSRGGMLGYAKAHALSRNPVPSEASRPFDEARDGFVPGE
ncbi:beta-ketoacyl synthase N-terminal-like domain-containing protein, partial [Bilophila wadsworthia]